MIRKLIEKGLKQHRAGRPDAAKLLYEQVLKRHPRHPDALHLAGVAALQCGEPERAVTWMERAIQESPRNPAFLANLAQAYLALERHTDALVTFRRAAELDPREPQFAIGAANCVAMLGNAPEAEQLLRDVLKRHPGLALAWFNLARAVAEQGRLDEAVAHYQRAIEADPRFADAHRGLGSVLHLLGRFEEAEAAFRRQFALQPYSEEATCQLASMLIDRGRFAEAATLCRDALRGLPASVELHLKLGAAQVHDGRVAAALETYRDAVRLAPDHPRARWGRGYTLVETGRPRAGLQWLDSVLAQQPDDAEFRDSRALIRLSLGDMQGGWEDYVWRAAQLGFAAAHPGLRLSDALPDDLSGRRVCLLREQGLGDELFFLRFAVVLKSLGAEIIHQAHPKLASLLGRVPALDRLIAAGESPPPADMLLFVGDLPRALFRPQASALPPRALPPLDDATTLAGSFPLDLRVFFPELPPPLMLSALPEQIERIRERLRDVGPPPYFGITWRAGTPPSEQSGPTWALHKAIRLDALAPVLRAAGGTWIALQRQPAPGEIDQLAALAGMPVHDFTALNDDLEAMLAMLALLDDYVGVSNTNMHLRAGTGRTARVLVPRPSEWRWLAAGDESPWFPGFRIYRQRPDGDWSAALAPLGMQLRGAASS